MDPIGADTETEPFSPGNMAPDLVCLSVADGDGEDLIHRTDAEEVLDWLLSQDRPVVIVNAAYDMSVTCANYPRLIPKVFAAYQRGLIRDPMICQKLIDLAMGRHLKGSYSLASLVKRLFNEEVEKDDSPRLDYGRLRDVPLEQWPEEHIEYPKIDARWHRLLYVAQWEGLQEEDSLEVIENHDAQAYADFALQLASVWGFITDPEGVQALEEQSKKRIAELEPLLFSKGFLARKKEKGVTKVVKKQAPAKEHMLEVMGGFHKVKLTKTGKQKRKADEEWQLVKYVSTDAEACQDSADDLLMALSEYTTLTSLLTGQLKAFKLGNYEPLHTHFDVLKETGRTGSSGGNAGNIQNVRRIPGVRECVKSRTGVLIGCDYDKAELHTLAQTCIDLFGYSVLGEALNAGLDPHAELGARLAGITYEELVQALKDGNEEVGGRWAHGKWASWRDIAKPGNFGFPGGMGPGGMMAYSKTQYGVILSFEQSEELYYGWGNQWPCVSQDYLGWIRSLCMDGFANIKHFISNRWRSHIPYTVAANSFFQGRAADGAKRALCEVARRQYSVPSSALYGTRTINFVHDELILESPPEQANDAAWELADVMVEEFNYFTPDVPVRATPCLMDRWSKKAKPIINAEGKLEVWKYESQICRAA